MGRTRSRRVILLWVLQSVGLSVGAYVTSTTCLSSSIRGASSFSRLMMRPEDTQSRLFLPKQSRRCSTKERSTCERSHMFNTRWCATSVLNTWSLWWHQQQHKLTAPHRSLTTAGRYNLMSLLSLRNLNPLTPQPFHYSTKLRSYWSAAKTSLLCSFCFII